MPSGAGLLNRGYVHRRSKAALSRCLLLCLLFVHLGPSAGNAEVTLDGSVGAGGALAGPDYRISHDLGQQRGGNLFHSFGKFNLSSAESATFSGPDTVVNIIGRVTGGSPSSIDGLIRSEIPGANLFLLNPFGVMFGPNASLDVKGSFHASTADVMRFSDGGVFYVNPAASSVLTVAPPSSFGFLSANPAGISIQESKLAVPAGKTLSVVGGEINIMAGPAFGSLRAPSGQIAIVGVASPGEVGLADFGTDTFSALGDVTTRYIGFYVEGANYNVDPAGTILIRGGRLVFQDTFFGARGNPGGSVNIRGEQLHLNDATINTATRGAADHPGVAVDINMTGDVAFTNGSEIASSGYGSGRAGDIRIVAGNVQLGDDDPTKSLYAANGFYGDIGSRAFGAGRGGNVDLTTGSLIVKNGFFINTAAMSSGDAGNITVRTGALQVLDRGSISSNGLGTGNGGIVDIGAVDVLLSARNALGVPNATGGTGIAAQTGYGSNGGAIRLNANNLQILDGAQISTLLFSIGRGANIEVTARNMLISGVVTDNRLTPPDIHASIDARVIGTYATGTGGNISIVSDSLQIQDGGMVSSSLFAGAPGNAGNIGVQTGSLDISNTGGIFASSVYGTGNAGLMDIAARDIRIIGPATSIDPFGKDFTGLSTSTNTGSGGDLHVTADSLLLTDRGSLTAGSFGAGAGGRILVNAGNVELLSGSNVIASAFGAGPGGDIELTAGKLVISGANPEVFTDFGGNASIAVSGIASQSVLRGGKAGEVRINAGELTLLDGGRISTETIGMGGGGNIVVQADSLLISGLNRNLGDFLIAQGLGADPMFAAASIRSGSQGTLDVPGMAGPAGNVQVRAGSITLQDHGVISSETAASGAGGNISISSDQVALSGGAMISAKSSGSGNAGSIGIEAKETFTSRDSRVTTEATQADGGNIELNAGYMIRLVDSGITSSVNGGPETGGGNISIDPNYVILKNSRIVANAFEGTGGNIAIVADTFLADPQSVVDASSTLGVSGTVDIRAPISNVSGFITPLSDDIISASSLLRERCIARIREGKYSSFVIGGRDGLPIEPGNLMPSLPY